MNALRWPLAAVLALVMSGLGLFLDDLDYEYDDLRQTTTKEMK